MSILVQMDRKAAQVRTCGGWHDTKRFVVTGGMTLTGANAIQDLGELNMSSRDTLIDFINWATENYPVERTMLIVSDHGYTYEGAVRDDKNPAQKMTPADRALALSSTPLKITVVGMDACEQAWIGDVRNLFPHDGGDFALDLRLFTPALADY